MDAFLSGLDISGSGMSAERLRMEVIANNIANASSTRTPGGGPFRRQDVVFSTVLGQMRSGSVGMRSGGSRVEGPRLGGVQVSDIVDDPSEFIQAFQPGHPDADANGMVQLPNVQLPVEMVNLITASRSYEANVKVGQAFKQMMEQSLSLLRG